LEGSTPRDEVKRGIFVMVVAFVILLVVGRIVVVFARIVIVIVLSRESSVQCTGSGNSSV